MQCHEIRERISQMLDNELSAEENALVTEHVASCPECMNVFQAFHAVSVAMEDTVEVPDGFTAQVMSRIHAAEAAPAKKRKPRILQFAAMAACFAVVLLAGSTLADSLGLPYPHFEQDTAYSQSLQDDGTAAVSPDPMPNRSKDAPKLFDMLQHRMDRVDGQQQADDGAGNDVATATMPLLMTDSVNGNEKLSDAQDVPLPTPTPMPDHEASTDAAGNSLDAAAPTLEELLAPAEPAEPVDLALLAEECDFTVTIPLPPEEAVLYADNDGNFPTERTLEVWLVGDRVVCHDLLTDSYYVAAGTPEEALPLLEEAAKQLTDSLETDGESDSNNGADNTDSVDTTEEDGDAAA